MRPYLAVVKDSFREALASRVLWILLCVITLILLALTPFSFEEEAASALQRKDFLDGPRLAETLVAQGRAAQASPGRRIWQLLSPELQQRLLSLSPADDPRTTSSVLRNLNDELNDLLLRRDFYEPAAWESVALNGEVRALSQKDPQQLTDEEVARFNRLLLDEAFPDLIDEAPDAAIFAAYFGYKLGNTLPFEPQHVHALVKVALVALISFLAGVLGVFVAILVTASIIPNMFEPGAIDLLLSKPVSRSLLFLSRFLGACAFILLNAAYLIVGLWLIVGLRFDLWSSKLLLCIPVFLFLFAVYYSVSALAGVVWKNAVVSVIVTILFWAACFTVGTAKQVSEAFLDPTRLTVLIPAGDTLLAMNQGGETFEWQQERQVWEQVFERRNSGRPRFNGPGRTIGPVYDPYNDQIVAVETASRRFGFFGGSGKLVVARRSDDWRAISSVTTPADVRALFIHPTEKIVAAGTAGVYRFDGDPTKEHKPIKLFGLINISPPNLISQFVEIGPPTDAPWEEPFAAAMHPVDGTLAVYSSGVLTLLTEADDGNYTVAKTVDLETDDSAVLALAGDTLLLALESGDVRVFTSDSLEPKSSDFASVGEKPRTVTASPDGRWFAVLSQERRLWLYDAEQLQLDRADIAGQGGISAAAFSSSNNLLAADRFTRVSEYGLESMALIQTRESPSELLEFAYRYVIRPVYTVFPKPGEIDSIVAKLLIDESDLPFGGDQGDTGREGDEIDLRPPVYSNLLFLTAVLALTCVYVSRRDF